MSRGAPPPNQLKQPMSQLRKHQPVGCDESNVAVCMKRRHQPQLARERASETLNLSGEPT